VSDYGLDDWAIAVRSPAEVKDFSSSLCIQTGSEVHPASCPKRTRGPFPGGKARPGLDADHSPPSRAEVVNELELYLLSPQAPPWRVVGLLYFFTLLFYATGLMLPQRSSPVDASLVTHLLGLRVNRLSLVPHFGLFRLCKVANCIHW
jgi:hypothetical protein